MQNILEQRLIDLIGPLVTGLNLSLWGLELAFGPKSLVRVYVEGDSGVDIGQCAELSRLIGLSLDVEDIISGAYVLEVSSPGMERRYFSRGQLADALGEIIEVTFHEPVPDFPGRRKFRGVLRAVPSKIEESEANAQPLDVFLLHLDQEVSETGARIPFCFNQVKKAQRIHLPPDKSLPGKGPKKKTTSTKKPLLADGDEMLPMD